MKGFFPIVIFFFFYCRRIALSTDPQFKACEPRDCGNGLHIRYPFRILDQPSYCGYKGFELDCKNGRPVLNMSNNYHYYIQNIFYENQTLLLVNMGLLDSERCLRPTHNLTVENRYFSVSSATTYLFFFFNCLISLPDRIGYERVYTMDCMNNDIHHSYATLADYQTVNLMNFTKDHETLSSMSFTETCESWATEPVRADPEFLYGYSEAGNYSEILKTGFVLDYGSASNCNGCVESGGRCGFNDSMSQIMCLCRDRPQLAACPADNEKRRKIRKIIIGVGAGVGGCILTCFLFFICHRYRQRRFATASKLLSRSFSSDPSSQSELGKGGSILPTHIFTYKELEDATNNFDPSKELGDGGFGTVYHGKLRDGRSVAVKRLYENNCRRVEQFMNEIDILSRLRHQSLVTLYGCTSRHSRELLLVYEFIPNGTVADHLHGNHAKDGALTWPIRMSIAIESADALAYLHAVEIIHRDVKTNNILLDNNFNVKVADFGLSRLFPTDRTHVSTAPQGTPGYVDPDYHRCYQLNNKSDVYSFGVVLIELISSKPAVDITRHRQEINLANMAINKIHNNALNELVDPTLGYESDHAVRRMITLVAELAFRCLQDEKEVRPTMQEVLEVLKGIQREDYKVEKAEELDVLAVADDAVLLKKFRPLSPDSVTDTWISRSTTPSASG
ncbi:LEAF RUST 10 DISEASE-RESISTANCE LOCUS RECEPTOR-LIKE PROTEIN KINASE-like 1.2 isoform X2 [Magnolia sinica]|uniref:LEAF RUST 10 DISEASE-RESISTANCE LOCUS RECEPTOR-LIKE PROTEIN KINASE-like 1.2 isoform X2 n=1 Tax=Magnolia sinica TaxID=86752 RepID=UPI00265AB94A|nr:LEAF RUST 10 DISEASE-RESISTANCE LOCUS RECEPTOR-LIKE PROTEIN KINASE-like 1.2 isoform X2 [Magnolia sinica]